MSIIPHEKNSSERPSFMVERIYFHEFDFQETYQVLTVRIEKKNPLVVPAEGREGRNF